MSSDSRGLGFGDRPDGTITRLLWERGRQYIAAKTHAVAEGHDVAPGPILEGYDRALHLWVHGHRPSDLVETVREWWHTLAGDRSSSDGSDAADIDWSEPPTTVSKNFSACSRIPGRTTSTTTTTTATANTRTTSRTPCSDSSTTTTTSTARSTPPTGEVMPVTDATVIAGWVVECPDCSGDVLGTYVEQDYPGAMKHVVPPATAPTSTSSTAVIVIDRASDACTWAELPDAPPRKAYRWVHHKVRP